MDNLGNRIGIYVHIPFCKRKCPYCDFYSVTYEETLEEDYVNAILKDANRYRNKGITADTLYFGGGTPSLIKPQNIKKIIDELKEVFSLDGEITLEANPNSVDEEKLIQLKNAGINRLSFGMQSGNEEELKALGRLHSKNEAIEAVKLAKKVGFFNISVDLMLGTPYQTIESIDSSLAVIKEMEITHVSAYMLKVEENTPYYKSNLLNYCANEDSLADIYLKTADKLEQMGFQQYEISNFAKKGYESKHNLKYWRCEEYISFGAAAHSFYQGKRYCNKPDIKDYIKYYGENFFVTDENAGTAEEYIMLSLRLCEGLDLVKLENKYGINENEILKKAKKYIEHSLMKYDERKIQLTKQGFLVSNQIISDFLINNYQNL